MVTDAQTKLLTSIAAATRERLGAAACSVALLHGDELEFCAADGIGAREVVGLRSPISRGISGWVMASGQTAAVADAHHDARFDRDTAQQTGYLPTSILATPIEGDDGPIGVLEVLDRAGGPHDMQVAARAAQQVALVLDITAAATTVDDVLGDPRLAELVGLVRQLDEMGPKSQKLAARLLSAVVENTR